MFGLGGKPHAIILVTSVLTSVSTLAESKVIQLNTDAESFSPLNFLYLNPHIF